MTENFIAIEGWFQALASFIPLPVFVFIGSGLEEFFSIIPTSLVMGIAGSLALLQGEGIYYLFFLAFIGNIARLFGAYFYYWLGDKLEDVTVPYLEKYFGIGHIQLESIGSRFSGGHWKDGGALFVMRALPFFPVTLTSIVCGVIKINMRVYLIASFLGNFIKDLTILIIGFVGLASLGKIWKPIFELKVYVDGGMWIIIVALLITFFLMRGTGRRWLTKVCNRCMVTFDKQSYSKTDTNKKSETKIDSDTIK